ncbi:MAG TPA: GspH/FimT family pseudopilin [Noviherbaspirillum sp.]|uniref:GspH/FimT family pseudopilin n=1 Tax=Noviherbaspirillum sp. TaxID=1926288 RepID=UPI002F94C975
MTRRADAPPHKQRGFTLVEMLVVLTVALILACVAAPEWRSVLDSRRVAVAANDFLAAIQLARSEALHRGERVDLAALDDDWRNGWTVFIDRNRNRLPDDGEDVVARHSAAPAGVAIESTLLDNQGKYLAYDGSGRSRTDASAWQPQFGTIRFRVGAQRRHIVLNILGRPRVCTPAKDAGSC